MDNILTETACDLRDRALIATFTYSFARITAALTMTVDDLPLQNQGRLARTDQADIDKPRFAETHSWTTGDRRFPQPASRSCRGRCFSLLADGLGTLLRLRIVE